MSNNYEKEINLLNKKLNKLIEKQDNFYKEIALIRAELEILKNKAKEKDIIPQTGSKQIPQEYKDTINSASVISDTPKITKTRISQKHKRNLEKFIGENVISKIGIIITIIGLAIGTKYSVEHNLISPLIRILSGYGVSLAILFIGLRLKKKYLNYSAVLVSGAMASMYFITFSAFNYYELIPRMVAYPLMIIITVFTIIAALKYNLQVIAHIGMIGAYAIPFLLSDNSGNMAIFFSYICIINIGILIISYFKNWKPILNVTTGLTWIIYTIWYFLKYNSHTEFQTAIFFASLFFLIFYSASIAYKIKNNKKFSIKEVILIVINSFIFYALGYNLLNEQENLQQLVGLFTILNAIIHFVVSFVIYKQKLSDRNLFHFLVGLAIVFITIAIPVQLNGNWVTLLWTGQAVLLYYLGIHKQIKMFETLFFPLLILSFISLAFDFKSYRYSADSLNIPIILNIDLFSHLICSLAYAYITWLCLRSKPVIKKTKTYILKVTPYILPAIFIISLYYTFRLEISKYWMIKNELSSSTILNVTHNILGFKTVYLYLYTLLFSFALSLFQFKFVKQKTYLYIFLIINGIVTGGFLTEGLYTLGILREAYQYISIQILIARYLNILAIVIILIVSTKLKIQVSPQFKFDKLYDILFHIIVLTLTSNELITWLYQIGFENIYKTILSILFGLYSLFLIWYGFRNQKQHLRIFSFTLFGATLLKLLFYDLTNLTSIQKTIVFVSLGALLLIISFLYNKLKLISGRK